MNSLEDIYGNIYEDISTPANPNAQFIMVKKKIEYIAHEYGQGYESQLYKEIEDLIESINHNEYLKRLKDISLELLEEYYMAERSIIFDRSGNIDKDLKELEKRCDKYRKKINEL